MNIDKRTGFALIQDPDVRRCVLRPGERLREYECAENNEDTLRYEKLLKNEPLFDGKP